MHQATWPCSPCSVLLGYHVIWVLHGRGSCVKWLTDFFFHSAGTTSSSSSSSSVSSAVTLLVKEQWNTNGVWPPPPKTRREDNTLREARALERCTGIADYFPGDRWQRLQMTGDRRRCQYISVNYDCNKTQCVWRRGLNKYVSCTSRDIALIIIMAIFLY